MQDLVAFLPLLAIALIFWLLVIRPQQRRSRELMTMQHSLSVGDEVMLTSGVYGTLVSVDDDSVLLEVAPGTTLKVARGAVGQVVQPGVEPQDAADPEEN